MKRVSRTNNHANVMWLLFVICTCAVGPACDQHSDDVGSALAPAVPRGLSGMAGVEVASHQEVDVMSLNRQLVEAEARGAILDDPLMIAYELVRAGMVAKAQILMEAGPGEQPQFVKVTIVQEGLLDDSIKGYWMRIMMRLVEGKWRVESAQQAFRCARGGNTEIYGGDPCP